MIAHPVEPAGLDEDEPVAHRWAVDRRSARSTAAYARYFVKFVEGYRAAGVPVYAVTVQNEPQNRNPSGYPGMDLPAWPQEAS